MTKARFSPEPKNLQEAAKIVRSLGYQEVTIKENKLTAVHSCSEYDVIAEFDINDHVWSCEISVTEGDWDASYDGSFTSFDSLAEEAELILEGLDHL